MSDSPCEFRYTVGPLSLGFDLAKTPSASAAPAAQSMTEQIAAEVRTLAGDHNADLSPVKAAVESAEKQRKERIEKALAGQADLAIIAGTKGRRFVLVYFVDGKVKTTEGIEYPVKRDEDGNPEGYSVLIDDRSHRFYTHYASMENLREILEKFGYLFHIAYFDQAK